MRAIIFTYPLPNNLEELYIPLKGDLLIGVDGALDSLKFSVDIAVGDFDSVSDESNILAKEIIKLPTNKDVTDTKKACQIAETYNPKEIIIFGGIGGERPEHFIANLNLLTEFDNLKIINNKTVISLLKHGVYDFNDPTYFYSFFATMDTKISLSGFIYELDEYELNMFDSLAISNEIKDNLGYVIIDYGSVVLIKSLK